MADMVFHSQVRTQLTLSTLTKHRQELEIVLKFVILIFSRELLHDKPNRHWFFFPQSTLILTDDGEI